MALSIVFMGTPDFAVPCLSRLLADGHRIVGVFSQPDRPKGRGKLLLPPPVKAFALERGLAVFQPESLKTGEAPELLRLLVPDLIVVVAYGRILPPDILELPPLGCLNLHASLLPRLRGAAPIQWSLIRGAAATGVTSMKMARGLDTGDMYMQMGTPIHPDETAGELFERLSALGAECLSQTVSLLERGEAAPYPQQEELATYAPPIAKAMGALDFSKPAGELCNLVRGLTPSPGAFTHFQGRLLKVRRARPVEGFGGNPGELLDAKRLVVGCGGGALELLRVQPEGKPEMDGRAFICGRGAPRGEMFTFDSHS